MQKLIYHKGDWWLNKFDVHGFYFQDHSRITLHQLNYMSWDRRKTYTLLLDRRNIFVERYSKFKL